jgi:hypothetical protein
VRRGRLIGHAERNLDGDADENQRAGTGGINDVFGACDAMERACSSGEVAKKFDTDLIRVTRLHQHTIQPYRLAVMMGLVGYVGATSLMNCHVGFVCQGLGDTELSGGRKCLIPVEAMIGASLAWHLSCNVRGGRAPRCEGLASGFARMFLT